MDRRNARREERSAWLRLLVLAILAATLFSATDWDDFLLDAKIVAGYGIATLVALALTTVRPGLTGAAPLFVAADACLVVVMFHTHLFSPTDIGLDHRLTAPTLGVGFVLLTHVALRLQPRLVLLFAALVMTGWIVLILAAALSHAGAAHAWHDFVAELALVAAFAFASLVCWLLTRDHDAMLREAVAIERKRRNLARFFSPNMVADLEATPASLQLARREVAIMFVDLRSFTGFSESADPEEVAAVLSEYRDLVTKEVFAHGGAVDKFIGDGVMAVFGHPRMAADDAGRALRCALALRLSLKAWTNGRRARGRPGLDAGIGLNFGTVIGGILESGSHDEFTLFGDAVNVAQRLEKLCRPLGASLVVSATMFGRGGGARTDPRWIWERAAQLEGRTGTIEVAYLR